MALETLKDVTEIGGFKVVDMNAIKETNPEMFRPDGSMIYHIFDEKIRPFNFIYLRHDVNSLSFNLQNDRFRARSSERRRICQAMPIATNDRYIEGVKERR